MLSLARFQLRTDPYPIGLATDIFPSEVYQTFVDYFPTTISMYKMFSGPNRKWSLSEVNNPNTYHEFIRTSVCWKEFHSYIKSSQFLRTIVECVGSYMQPGNFRSRFEFSILPAHGGCLLPHTDIPSKVVTLVIPMMNAEEWKPKWGGGTDVLVPKDPAVKLKDYKAPLRKFDKVCSYEYAPNQALVFIKSKNSWHSVGPIKGPPGVLRKTLTENVERVA